ncbi:MAG: nucleotide pyrophosphohydrolase [Chloroflexi bacterium]|nr:nucleotide pyrophosphohydrolase [Chloroflexota bacterium]
MSADESTTIAELKTSVQDFVHERDWGKYHNPKDVALSIVIEAAELLEHFQWADGAELQRTMQDPEKMDRIGEELADVLIYCLSFANATGIDVAGAVREKIEKNKVKYPADQVRGNYRKYLELKGNERHR